MFINKLKRLLLNVFSKFNITYSFVILNFVVCFGRIFETQFRDSWDKLTLLLYTKAECNLAITLHTYFGVLS